MPGMIDPFSQVAPPTLSEAQVNSILSNIQPTVYGGGPDAILNDNPLNDYFGETTYVRDPNATAGTPYKDSLFGDMTNTQKMMMAGIPALLALMVSERRKYQPPGQQPYTGPLSRIQYNPSTYQPYDYRPYAKGGQTSSKPVHPMQAVDDYHAQAQTTALPQVLAAARGGDYNAMLALNRLYNTPNRNYASGGISDLGGYSDGGRLLRGPGDGVSDSIPAMIGQKQPARLADGEFVVPARIVSELGNGSTEAGARKLYAMMDRVQQARAQTTGKGKMAKNTSADKYLPV